MSSGTGSSRMIYAFSRGGAVPRLKIWHRLNRRRIPANAVLLASGAAFVLAIPYLFNSVAYYAVVSISVVAIYIAYVLPTLVRLLSPDFKQGTWNLGRFSKLGGCIAVIWVAFISVLFLLPHLYPVTRANFNYPPVAALASLLFLPLCCLPRHRC